MQTNNNRKSDGARIIQVIEVKTAAAKEDGFDKNIAEYWTLGGRFIASVDDPEPRARITTGSICVSDLDMKTFI